MEFLYYFDFDFFVLKGRKNAFGSIWSLVFTSTDQIIYPKNLKIFIIKSSPFTL